MDITPLARNEFICWVEDAKQDRTRERRIRRTQEELEEGQRRPCCWPGRNHRARTGRQPRRTLVAAPGPCCALPPHEDLTGPCAYDGSACARRYRRPGRQRP